MACVITTKREFPALAWMLRYPVRPWVGPVLVSIFAAFLRFFRLKTPPSLVFDETYYVKQGDSLLGLGYEGRWAGGWGGYFAAGGFSGFRAGGGHVVQPPVGELVIGLGRKRPRLNLQHRGHSDG